MIVKNPPRVLCHQLPEPGQALLLEADESHHLRHVLRLEADNLVWAMDGKGSQVECVLESQSKKTLIRIAPDAEPLFRSVDEESFPCRLEMAAIKSPQMESVIAAATQIGVREFQPVLSARTVAPTQHARILEKWRNISRQSLKQCGRLNEMPVLDPIPLEQLPKTIDYTRWILSLGGLAASEWGAQMKNRPLGESNELTALSIGPEGGWTSEDLKILKNLGKNQEIQVHSLTLRAETAAIYGLSVLHHHWQCHA